MSGVFTPVTPGDKRFAWMAAPAIQKIVHALVCFEQGSARFVGGCVRDSLMGETPKDVDIATTLTPNNIIAALSAAGLRSAPTGIDHGTVTAIADHVGVEVTTLRADISTDGRRATVAFTRDWSVDASRRDFTINALYLTPDGELFDMVGGLADLEARRVRFIGDPAARIREDYLRILRFFRFSARFSAAFDGEGLSACTAERKGMRILSAERIGDEFSKILNLCSAASAVQAMVAADVLEEVWPAQPDIEALSRLKSAAPDAPAALGLAALWGEKGEGIGARLRLPNSMRDQRATAVAAAPNIAALSDEKSEKALLYRIGPDAWRDGCLVAIAFGADPARISALMTLPERWSPPKFPVSGKDVLAAGIPAGPGVARILNVVERAWMDENYPNEARAQELLRAAVATISKG